MARGMDTDYSKEAASTVAMKFPMTGRPPLLRSSYPKKTWQFMIARAHQRPEIHVQFVLEDTDEGQAIIKGTPPSDITSEYLMGLEEATLREIAESYGIRVTDKQTRRSLALKVLAAIDEGVKPKIKGLTGAVNGE